MGTQMIVKRKFSCYIISYCKFSVFARTDTDMVMDEEIDLDALKTYGTPDILICGNCRLEIRDVKLSFSLFYLF